MLSKKIALVIICSILSFTLKAQIKLNVVVAGLNHDHIYGIMNSYKNGEINILSIAEPNAELVAKYKKMYNIPANVFYTNLTDALKNKKPDVVLAYNAISDHINVVEIAAPLGLSVMVEKPLCLNNKEAERIAFLAKKYNVKVLTNYETTWYPSNQEAYLNIKTEDKIGSIVKMIAHDGHQGPKEIGVSKEFLSWLTDPAKNGAGALVDFGCYGANLMTWMMDGKMPISVMAVTHQIKPDVYPKVDDDATILLEYKNAIGIIEASWNWPFSIKDFEAFGKSGYLQTVNNNTMRFRKDGMNGYDIYKAKELDASKANYLGYLTAVLKDKNEPKNDLSSLSNNIIVVKILSAAKESAKTGKKVYLK
ncbi:MAG: Gfo/Idh/MocA family oxidoreductase [Pedobacter sp.]|nr:Gfo/Idh/MocA family oxidoreductase [Pedobacter sp.]